MLHLPSSSWRFPRLLLAALGLWAAFFVSSCGKDEPKPVALGAIEAQITPAGSVRSVTLTGTDGRTYQTVPDATTGSFSFANLVPGRYILSFETIPAYNIPAPVAVDVSAAATARPSFEPLVRDRTIRGTMTWTVGNKNYSADYLQGEITDDSFALRGHMASVSNPTISLEILKALNQAQPFRGVGVYELGTSSYSQARFYYSDEDEQIRRAYGYRTLFVGQRVGAITITSFNPKAFIVTGTFEFTARNFVDMAIFFPTTPENITVTKGTFSLVSF